MQALVRPEVAVWIGAERRSDGSLLWADGRTTAPGLYPDDQEPGPLRLRTSMGWRVVSGRRPRSSGPDPGYRAVAVLAWDDGR